MNDPKISLATLRRIDQACDQFEEAWRAGENPRLETFLTECEVHERTRLLESLQKLQQELILSQLQRKSNADTQQLEVDPQPVVQTAPARVRHDDVFFKEVPARVVNSSNSKVLLKVIAGPHEGEQFDFEGHDTLLVGRSTQAKLQLRDDPHFSRHHCRLEIKPPTCYLMDLHSRNGTYVNGERISERFLEDGDIISGGRTKMIVSISNPDASTVDRPTFPLPAGQKRSSREGTDGQSKPQKKSAFSVPGYEIHEQLGEGDLGVVFRAERLSVREPCALKVLMPEAQSDEKSIKEFLREATVLSQLQHPHIVRFLEMGAAGDTIFLATEYVDSIPWSRIVTKNLPEKRIRLACGLMCQILSGLQYAHSRSLVHRDVKPSNILILKKEGKLIAKLSDFGLAKQYTMAGMSQITRDGDVLGSLPYMSPDQFSNSREARPTCDIYSAGATLYWLLTGHEPIRMDSHPCKFLAILEAEPTPIQKYNPDVPDGLAHVVHCALEKTAEKRFTSAAEMRERLKKFAR